MRELSELVEAAGRLGYQPQDVRAVAALESILRTETDRSLRSQAHHALKHQHPNYRARVDKEAREGGIAAARARHSTNPALGETKAWNPHPSFFSS